LHLDRAPPAHPHPLALQRLQPPRWQRTQPRLLLVQLRGAPSIPPGEQLPHKLPVGLSTSKVPATPQQQFLFHGLFEPPMALLAIAVLMAAVGVRGFGRQPVVSHQRPVFGRVLLGVAVVMHRQRHAVGAVPLGARAEFPQRILQALTQAGEALREAQRRVFPVRVGQHKVVDQVGKRLAQDGNVQIIHVRKVRATQAARLMHLAEKHFLGRPVLRLPLPHPPLHRAPPLVPVLAWVFPLQHLDQRFRLQRRRPLQQFFQTRPDLGERIGPGPPGVLRPALTRHLTAVAVLPGTFGIHPCFHRCLSQRCPPLKVPTQFLDLSIRDLATFPHGATPFAKKLPVYSATAAAACPGVQQGRLIVAGREG